MADFALHLNKLISIMPFVAAIDLIDILVIRHAGCRIMLSFSYDVLLILRPFQSLLKCLNAIPSL